MSKLIFFSGVPINDAATLHRSGLVAKRLASLGYQVIFTSVSANFKGRKAKKVSGLPVLFIGQAHYFAQKLFSSRKRLRLGETLVENVKTCFRFSEILREEKPDRVLVVTSMPISLMAGLVSRVLGFKTLIDIEDLVIGQMEASGYPRSLVGIYGLLEKAWVRIFDKVAVCSHFLQKRYPGSHLLLNMIEVAFWIEQESRRAGDQEKKIVFVGQMGPYHGQMEVLQSLAPVLKETRKLKLVFVGAGEMEERLKLKTKELRLEKQVVFTGQLPQDEVRRTLATAHIGLLPLWNTPVHQARHPLKLLEYLASGLMVVANKVGEAARQIKDGENGILCPPGDIDCLAEKVRMILENPHLAQEISKKATVSVQEFSVGKILPRWIEFLS